MASVSTDDTAKSRVDRAAGAVMGVLVGDALGMGMQWYYDLADKDAQFGPWVTDYVAPDPNRKDRFAAISKFRCEQGMKAGDSTQLGQVFGTLLEAAGSSGRSGFKADFTARVDKLFGTLSGESLSGRYTDALYIKARQARVDGHEWGTNTATDETTGDGALFAVVLAAMYIEPLEMMTVAMELLSMFLQDRFIVQNSVVFGLSVQALINGVPMEQLGQHIKQMGFKPEFRTVLGSFDNFLSPGYGVAGSPGTASFVAVEPPKLVGMLFGPDCQLTHLLPAAYYLAHRFPGDFENAVLSASNGGGQNVARAAMTGALSGATVGASGIPKRWIDGLERGTELLQVARKVAGYAATE